MSANAADGSNEQVHKIVQGEAVIREPRFSSDGRTIYFVRRDLDDGVENWSMIVFDPLTSSESVLIRQRERIGELAVLHDRSALLTNATDPISNRRQLFYVALPNGKVTRITNDIKTYIGVSIDRASKTIVTAQRTEEARVFVGDSDDMFSMSAFSRDGKRFAVIRGRVMTDAVMLYSVSGSDR
ncbi:PD40 domain-containing protein [Leptolyngbya sp. 7M]|uniref:PD40 domain-containing protein n=1 Tax=Leptolyngbya sp. 7M TaxID=2812896 RepID=UPI001B8B7BA3|nr:PD40 domain-containing protein [Leptolyngbya sp. 7M]QYO67753.1 PD40 domain-containing protein [Leptolyngbya sp. 7M]